MEKLDLGNIDSIINCFKNSKETTRAILEEQSGTLFNTRDYYEGRYKAYKDIVMILSIYKEKNDSNTKETTIEFSKDVNKAETGIIGAIEEGRKVVEFYKVDREKYEPKFKEKEVTINKEHLKELGENSKLIGKLKFYNDESIESLIHILSEMYKLKLEDR